MPTPQELERTLLDAFLGSITDVVYFKDRDCRFIAVSRSKARRHGFDDPAQIVGKSDSDFFSSEHASKARRDEEAIMATGRPLLDQVERLVWPDGRITWARTSKMPLTGRDGKTIGTFGLSKDITAERELEESLEKAQRDLIAASRAAGMAEVATGVLHNVGNVLNSVNVSASMIGTTVRQSKIDGLAKIARLLEEHRGDLAAFLADDAKGRLIPSFLESMAQHLEEERRRLLEETEQLQKNIDHIKEIVSMQQAYATMIGAVENLEARALMEDALRMNAAGLDRHTVELVRDYRPVPPVVAERGKVLQILINLIRNAKYAISDAVGLERRLTLRIGPGDAGTVRFTVEDTGVGIPTENLDRIFSLGFTTRADGHGFGLHSSALAAKEMGGSLTVKSGGSRRGAAFCLELPAAAQERTAAVTARLPPPA
jgi:PAS domain S-box-containing protein